MNDISAKSEESSKPTVGDEQANTVVDETGLDNLDSLAATGEEVVSLQETEVAVVVTDPPAVADVEPAVPDVANCDENTKEKIETDCKVTNEIETLDIESTRIQEEPLKCENSSIDDSLEDSSQKTESGDASIQPVLVPEVISVKTELEIPVELTDTANIVKELTDETLEISKSPQDLKKEESPKVTIEIALETNKRIEEKPLEPIKIKEEPSSPVEIAVVCKTENIESLKENEEVSVLSQKKSHSEVKEKDIVTREITHVNKPECTQPSAAVLDDKPEKKVEQEKKVEIEIPKQSNIENITIISDVEMKELAHEIKVEKHMVPTTETAKPSTPPVNGDVSKGEQPSAKRPSNEEMDTESPLKRLCQEVEKNFPHHDSMINDYVQNATKNNVDDIQRHTEQLLAEIQTLRELAQKKELEWNNILHLKKVKEEILLRLLRKKQVISFEKSSEVNGKEPYDYLNSSRNLAIDKSDEISGLMLKPPTTMNNQPMIQPPVMPVTTHFNPMAGLPPPYDKAAHMAMPKVFPQNLMMPGPTMSFPREMNGQMPNFALPMGRQGPIKDVKSIIADYRQRNPDVTPRRGRRMKSILNPNMMNAPRQIAPKIDNLGNLNNLGMIFNNLDMNQKAMLERLSQMQGTTLPNGMSFKDVLVQFANIQQQTAGLIPPQNRPDMMSHRPEVPVRPETRRRPERPQHEEVHTSKVERVATSSPRLPPPPPYPEISLLPVSHNQEGNQQSSLLHGILTKQASPSSQSYSPTLAKLLTSPERNQKATLPTFGQAKNCGEITITPVQPAPAPPHDAPPEKTEVVVQLDDEESHQSGESPETAESSRRLVIDEGEPEAPPCQGCRRRAAQFVCAGCANQWYCSRDCQVAAWDEHSEMCSG